MRKTLVFTLLVLLLAAAARAGDIKFILVRQYNDPNWQPGNLLVSSELANRIEVQLVGEAGEQELQGDSRQMLLRIYRALRPGGSHHSLLQRVAQLRNALNESTDLYVYLVDDLNGLTPVMREYAGLCDYTRRDDTGQASTTNQTGAAAAGRSYAWLCSHSGAERAVKVGEHFAREFYSFVQHLSSEPSSSDLDGLYAAIVAEALHSVLPVEWHPNNLVVPVGDVTVHSFGRDTQRRSGAGINMEVWPLLTLMPTEEAARMRALELYTGMVGSDYLRRVLSRFYTPPDTFSEAGMMTVRKGTAAHTAIGRQPDRDELPAGHAAYRITSLSLDKLVDNEVFGALVLYYFNLSQPIVAGQGNTQLDGLGQVLAHVQEMQTAGLDLFSILEKLMQNYQRSVNNNEEQIRNRLLYLMALMDLLSNYMATRDVMQAVLETALIPEGEMSGLLDRYFGAAGSSDNLRSRVSSLASDTDEGLSGMLEAVARHFNQRVTTTGNTSR